METLLTGAELTAVSRYPSPPAHALRSCSRLRAHVHSNMRTLTTITRVCVRCKPADGRAPRPQAGSLQLTLESARHLPSYYRTTGRPLSAQATLHCGCSPINRSRTTHTVGAVPVCSLHLPKAKVLLHRDDGRCRPQETVLLLTASPAERRR